MSNYLLCSAKVLQKKMSKGDKQSEEQRKAVENRLQSNADKFHNGYWKNIKDTGYDNMDTFEYLWVKSTGIPLDPTTFVPTIVDIRKFEIGLNRFNKALVKKEGWISGFFKLPRTILKKLPELDRFQQEMIAETSFFRRQTTSGSKRANTMLTSFKKIAAELGSNTKELTSLENAIDAARVKGDKVIENKLLRKRADFYVSGSGRAYMGLMKAFQGADIESIAELPTRKSKALMTDMMGQWHEMRQETSVSLVRGMEKVVKLAKGNPAHEKLVEKMVARIKEINFQRVIDSKGRNIEGKHFKADADILKYGFTVESKDSFMDKNGNVMFRQYMPHYVLGIPKMLYTAEKLFRGGEGESIKDLNKAVEMDLKKMDGFINRIRSRNDTIDTDYHLDPFYFLKKYVSDVSIFNYRTHIKDTFHKAYGELASNHLLKAKESKNVNSVEMLENMMKMTSDVYKTLSNVDPYKDTTGNNLMRFMTSLTYFRLLGGNIRSGARNGTQRIHEVHNFGIAGVAQANRYYNERGGAEDNTALANSMAKEYGLLWFSGKNVRHKLLDTLTEGGSGVSEASRGALGESFIADYGLKVNEHGEIVRHTASASRKIAGVTSKVAEKSAFMHRIIEDWNRTNTFRVAFALAHENLGMMSMDWKMRKSKMSKLEDIKKWEAREAGKIAYNQVLDIHYEYAKWAKAKSLQGGAGQFLGQFMHYRFSLFDMMYKWADQAGVAVRAGDFTGQETWRLMRLGTTTAMITGVFAPLLNTKFSGLFQNDVKETAEVAYDYFTADRNNPEEMENLDKKTFGQGGYYFLGPNVNFLMSMSELKDFYFMDEVKYDDYLKNIDFVNTEQTNKRFKLMSLVNAQLARSWNYTAPLFYKRGIIDAARMELGLFPDKDMRAIRKTAQQWLGKNVHKSLAPSSGRRDYGRKNPNTPEEREKAINVLNYL